MSSTFSSLSTALSALRYNQTAMDVASGNVANAGTDGYARRQAVAQATGAPVTPALWSRWNGAGDGVEAGRIDRMVDPLLDSRSRTEHASSSYLDTRATSLARFETSIDEPGETGISAALASFKQSWHDLANNPGDGAARGVVLARAEDLRSTIAQQAGAVSTEWSDQRTRLDAAVSEVNGLADQLSQLNQGLRSAHLSGTDAGTLLDQRDQLMLRMSELTGASFTINGDTSVDVKVAGQTLVSASTTAPLQVAGSTTLAGAGADPVGLSIGGTQVTIGNGEIGADVQLLGRDLPDYLTQLDSFVSTLAGQVNAQQQAGNDLTGTAGTPLFSGTTATTLTVAITDPNQVAAADPTKGKLDGSNATALANLDLGADGYRRLVSGFGVTVSSARSVSTNQATLTAQVDAARESVSGINTDEEMANLVAAQRGYEGAARVMTTLDSMLDTLINHTGLVG
ncbi:MAG: flagellar hook-associated protein FlgK [Nocardioidaceae bacterium]